MMTIEFVPALIASGLAVPLYRWADRRVGSGGPNVLGPLGGRSVGFLAGGLVGAGLGYVAAGPAGAVLGPFWSLYRSLNFKGGALVPVNDRERRNAVLRHLVAVLAAGPVYVLGGPWIVTAATMTAYAVVASYLAFGLGELLIECQQTGKPWNDEWNATVERARGLSYGLAVALIWSISSFMEAL